IIDSILIDDKNIGTDYSIEYTKGVVALEESEKSNSAEIKLYFKTVLPESGDRLSYNGTNYLLNGWFPTPAVLNNNGEWYHPEYRRNAELVSDYFIYDVKFSAPPGFVVVGPGSSLVGLNKNEDSTKHLFLFGPALDFALAIDADYLIDGSVVEEDTIRIYYRDYEYPILSKIKNAVNNSLAYMEKHVGKYEYGSLNLVFSDIGFSGGIEFPAMIALSTPRGAPAISNAYDMLTVHEVVHQWFYSMIGSNQVEYPWLDESITNFF
ncbi:MAG: M1 family metallopeptidase, partial [candidate division Zixibacteria bacterium]|nr:M1 family metallopeptidase [candidate division Zixibacteria bacterium]